MSGHSKAIILGLVGLFFLSLGVVPFILLVVPQIASLSSLEQVLVWLPIVAALTVFSWTIVKDCVEVWNIK